MILTDLLDREIDYYSKKIWEICADIEIDKEIVISPLIRNIENFEAGSEVKPFYINILNEGVILVDEKNNLDFSLYRLKRAKEEKETTELLYRENKLLAANNRAYYSIFYAIRSVLALERIDFKRHKDVLAYFNKNYVKTDIFPRQIGKKIVLASKVREDSDYDEDYNPNPDTTFSQIETAKKLIALI